MANLPSDRANVNETASDPNTGEIVLYSNPDGSTIIDVRLEDETVWLSQAQMVELFDKDQRTISEHIQTIYGEGELDRSATYRKFRLVRTEGNRRVNRSVDHYNLDVIISVGYRVSSKKGTQFRIWATSILKDHLIKGYSLNERRWRAEQLEQFQRAVALFPATVQQLADRGDLSSDESVALMRLVTDYASSWVLLRQYDDGELASTPGVGDPTYVLTVGEARTAIGQLRRSLEHQGEASTLFGNDRGEAFEAILGALYQTFGGEDLYPTIEQKAAHLLYFVIKDHPFSDGNKRIGSFLFLHFLDRNHYLTDAAGAPKINPATLVALALLVAESDPRQKEVVIQLIIHFLVG